MYLRTLSIKNLKLLREVEVSFLRETRPRMWTVFVGQNGLCKTSILRAIALVASGRDRANQLAQNFTPSMLDKRRPDAPCTISAVFSPDDSERKGARIRRGRSGPLQVRSELSLMTAQQTLFEGRSAYAGPGTDYVNEAFLPLEEARASDRAGWFARSELSRLGRAAKPTHVENEILPRVVRIREAEALRAENEVRRRWDELRQTRLRVSCEFWALSFDALDSLVPGDERLHWGLMLPRPP